MSFASDPALASDRPAAAQSSSRPVTAKRQRRSKRAVASEVVLQHYLNRVDPAVARSFSDEQREAIKTMLGARGAARHLVEVRRSVPFGRRRWYVVFLFGTERRSLQRLKSEGMISRPFNLLVYLVLGVLVLAPAIGLITALGL